MNDDIEFALRAIIRIIGAGVGLSLFVKLLSSQRRNLTKHKMLYCLEILQGIHTITICCCYLFKIDLDDTIINNDMQICDQYKYVYKIMPIIMHIQVI